MFTLEVLQHWRRLPLVVFLMAGLLACGDDSGGGSNTVGEVSGRVFLPSSFSDGCLMVAVDTDESGSNGPATHNGMDLWQLLQVTGNSVAYSFDEVPSGDYFVWAYVDLDAVRGASGECLDVGAPQDGDLMGFYGGGMPPSGPNVTVPHDGQNFDVTVQELGSGGSCTPSCSGACGDLDGCGGICVDSCTAASELVGTWALSDIDGYPGTPDSSDSTLVFNSDNTYTWCLNLAGYDFEGDGQWTYSSGTLTADGILLVATDRNIIALTVGVDTISFDDDEGDEWTYVRDASATGCN